MITLLKSYFISGNEEEENRTAFDKLMMNSTETFPTFKARFLSAAIKGKVARTEWYFYLWQKITPQLRMPNLSSKRWWNNSFDEMVAHLTAYDMERRNGPEPSQPSHSSSRQVTKTTHINKPGFDSRRLPSGSAPTASNRPFASHPTQPLASRPAQPYVPPV